MKGIERRGGIYFVVTRWFGMEVFSRIATKSDFLKFNDWRQVK